MIRSRWQTGLVAALGLALLAALLPAPGAAARVIHFQGRAVKVPGSWPVYRLARHPGMCVRLDRPAVYLGTPAANQRCPAGAIGRRRAIVVEGRAAAARASALPRRLRPATTSAGGAIFTGLGFDACAAPSARAMAAWAQSPYRAIGIYIGGVNRACSQPNLTPAWTAAQTAAGWHLIPTYVGLQAPTSACSSCAKLSAGGAVRQGEEAAVDAVAAANAVGIGPGSPIYFDMEAYTRTRSATSATLAFLEAWTEKLHALGYESGVYSSSSSGIADLAAQYGSGYSTPDNIWIANWNGARNTLDPAVPANAWANHERIHQYAGGHNETYGGVTINIDNNYVDAATAGFGGARRRASDPVGELNLVSTPEPGAVRVRGWAFDPDSPASTLAIRVTVGGRAGSRGAAEYDLGEIANLSRPAVGVQNPEAGPNHGFDTRFATALSGRQPVCVYAVGYAPGGDTLLGCKTIRIGVAVTISNLTAGRRGVRVRLTCTWPEGSNCPGWLGLRTRVEVKIKRRRRPPRVKAVIRTIGRRQFHLSGRRSHVFLVPLTRGGRTLLQRHGRLRTWLTVAIPGGRRVAALSLERPARRAERRAHRRAR